MKFPGKMALLSLVLGSYVFANELTLYSHRHYDADAKLFVLFKQKTGITIKPVQARANELAKRIEVEGKNSRADLFLTADAGNLEQVRLQGLFVPANSRTIERLSPKEYRGKNNEWIAIAKRARIIAVSKDRVPKGAIKDYEDLADPRWKGKILTRSSTHVYNTSLLSYMIETLGYDKAKQWAQGVANNLAREPKGGDREQIKAIYAREGDIAISNSYYLGHLLNSKTESDKRSGESVYIIFPNQEGRGTHINVSGIGILKASKNKENALKFIEFLLSPEAQEIITNENYEYPVNPNVKPAKILQQWGDFKVEKPNFEAYYKNVKEAQTIFDTVGWK